MQPFTSLYIYAPLMYYTRSTDSDYQDVSGLTTCLILSSLSRRSQRRINSFALHQSLEIVHILRSGLVPVGDFRFCQETNITHPIFITTRLQTRLGSLQSDRSRRGWSGWRGSGRSSRRDAAFCMHINNSRIFRIHERLSNQCGAYRRVICYGSVQAFIFIIYAHVWHALCCLSTSRNCSCRASK